MRLKILRLIVCLGLPLAVGLIGTPPANADIEYFPNNTEFFDIILLSPDRSTDPGHQVFSRGTQTSSSSPVNEGGIFFELEFDIPGTVTYRLPRRIDAIGGQPFYTTHLSGDELGLDDLILRVNKRDVDDPSLSWEYAPSRSDGGTIFEGLLSTPSYINNGNAINGGQIEVVIQFRWGNSPDFFTLRNRYHASTSADRSFQDEDYWATWTGINGKREVRHIDSDIDTPLKLAVFDNPREDRGRTSPQSGSTDLDEMWLRRGDIVELIFKEGTFTLRESVSDADYAKTVNDPDNFALQRNAGKHWYFELIRPDRDDPYPLHLNYIEPDGNEFETDGYDRHRREWVPILRRDEVVDPADGVEVNGSFLLEFLLTEEPVVPTAAALLTVTNGTVTRFDPLPDYDQSGGYDANRNGTVQGSEDKQDDVATGIDNTLYAYEVEILPDGAGDVVVSVNHFSDTILPEDYNRWTGTYSVTIPVSAAYKRDQGARLDGLSQAEAGSQPVEPVEPVAVVTAEIAKNRIEGTTHITALPEKLVIPANGYLVLARGKHDSDVADDNAPIQHSPAKPADKKEASQRLYNIHYEFTLQFPANDLANLFRNGGTLQLLHRNIAENRGGADGNLGYTGANNKEYAPGDVLINEIMWGLDRTRTSSQYIELHNTTSSAIGIDLNEWVISTAGGGDPVFSTVVDVMSNANPLWDAPGQSGATVGADAATPEVAHQIEDLVSMARVGTNGLLSASWAASARPSANLEGRRIGTPGAPNNAPLVESPDMSGTPVATAGDIVITEIMADTNAGQLPQWIEVTNLSPNMVSLNGWSVSIVNDPADDLGALRVPLDGLEVAPGQVVLIVSGTGRQSMRAVEPARLVNARRMLMSETGFVITLLSPSGSGDMAGNLAKGWELPTAAPGRRSLVRSGTDAGTEAGAWSLAEQLSRAYVETYYGLRSDIGTPGWHASGGALPVELSMFRASRDPVTGAVEIRWETASESNNAGFHITRSETRDGIFKAVNAAMIPGAGTTSARQSYTFTDATAKPHVVYYYQIEDVSLDGERQVLVSPHRLRGHISANGKTTLLWGDLKSRE